MPAATLPTCALCHRPPASGRLCWRHHDRLADLLNPDQHGTAFDPDRPDDPHIPASIPRLFELLDAAPATAGPVEAARGAAFASKPPADLHVVALRDPRSAATGPGCDDDGLTGPWSTLAVLADIAARLDVQDVHGRRIRIPRQVDALATHLHRHLDRLTHTPWIDEAWNDLRTVHAQLRAATGDPSPAPVGRCVQAVDDNGHPDEHGPWSCGWPLWLPHSGPRHADEPVQVPSLRCGSCGYRYSGFELVQLGRHREQVPA